MDRYKITLFLAALAIMVSCQEDPFNPDGEKGIEGIRTTLKLKLTPPKMEIKTRGTLPENKEKEIVSLAVFLFDQTGFIISSAMHESVEAHVTGGMLGVDAGASMEIPAISGPNRQIYAVANYDANQIENLKSVASLDDLRQLVVNIYGNPIYREFGMIKVGNKTQDIAVNGAAVSIPLEYISAKVTINVINKSADLIVHSWNIGNVPIKSYLLERPYNSANPNLNDAVDHNNDTDFSNDFSTLSLPFDTSESGEGTPTGKRSDVSFYLSENRQGTRPLANRKALEPPFTELTADSYKIKSWDAPQRATYITILGQKDPNSGNPKAILIKHYLGKNAHDNYDICRGLHYIYTITINNLNNINIDTNVESYENPISIEQGADLESLDAHASFQIFKLHTEANLPAGTKITAELANFANTTDYPTWLKLSLVPLVSSQIAVPTNDPKISRWQQTGEPWSYVRTKFIPHSSKRAASYPDPFPGFSFFGNASTTPTLNPTDNPDIYGQSAYPAYDDELPYIWAMRRMCNKITDIPTGTPEAIKLFLYADEYEIDGKDERSAVLRITHELNGLKTTKVYKITQKAPILFMGLPGDNTIMVVENAEEYAHLLQNELMLNLQMLAGLQWGDYKGIATNTNNGALNTLQSVYKTVTDKNNYSVNEYLPKYGSMAGGWSTTNNGQIKEGTAKNPIVGGSFYSFYTGTDNDYYNAIYNTTAARYCHEKNWDENGNGQIDPSEAKWYLPAQQELQLFWTYREKLKLDHDYYWSSTAANDIAAFALSMVESTSDPKYVYNGAQQIIAKIAIAGKNRPRVRCVRRVPIGSNVKRYMPMVIFENKSLLIDCSNLTSEMYTTESKYGLSQNNPGALQKANNKVYKKILVQLEQPAPIDYSSLHLNGGKCDESKGWRLPTQRELLLIWSVKDKIATEAGANFASFNNGLYWTMNRDLSKQYVIDFATGLAHLSDYSPQTPLSQLNYRCVKEVK